MLETKAINFRLTESAKDAIENRLYACDFPSPIPGIIWGKWNDEINYRWHIGFYERDKLIDGWIIKSSGLVLYTYQEQVISQLNDKTIDYIDEEFRVI